MILTAEHFDGFTEHLVTWRLEASGGSAIIDASWLLHGRRVERTFEMDFKETRIETCADALSRLKPIYDGRVDDFPTYRLSVTTEDRVFETKFHVGINWPEEDKVALYIFMSIWRPIYSDVERLLAIPGRSKKRKYQKMHAIFGSRVF